MYVHHAPTRPTTMLVSPEVPFPMRDFGVSHPNQDFPTATKTDSTPTSGDGLSPKDTLIRGLASLPPETEAQKKRKSELLGELAEVLGNVESFTAEVVNDRATRLASEHKEVRKLGRLAETALQKASEAYLEADLTAINLMSAQESQRIVLEHLHEDEQRGVHLKRFFTDGEVKAWPEKVEEAKELFRAVSSMTADAVRDRGQRQADLQAQKVEVARLAAIESEIRAELKGLPVWSELGLGRPGQGIMTSDIASMMARRDDE